MRKLLTLTAVLALAILLASDVDARGSRGGSRGGSGRGASAHKSSGSSGKASGKSSSAGKGNSASKGNSAGKSGNGNAAGKGNSAGKGTGSGNGAGRGGHKGAGYRGWSSWGWNAGFGCYFYWSDYDSTYYYWYGPEGIYRPIIDIRAYPPPATSYSTGVPGVPPMPQAQANLAPSMPQPTLPRTVMPPAP